MPNNIEDLLQKSQDVDRLFAPRKAVIARFPLLFTLLATSGLIATVYGFEKLIDQVPFLRDHPGFLFLSGLAILIFTGSLYKRLGRI